MRKKQSGTVTVDDVSVSPMDMSETQYLYVNGVLVGYVRRTQGKRQILIYKSWCKAGKIELVVGK